MKRLFFAILAVVALVMVSCQFGKDSNGLFRVEGQMESEKWDGKYIYLVPLVNTDSVGVDSAMVQGDKFVIETTHVNLMSVIRMDFHFRYGLEDLLVVTEPGTISVKIGKVSSASGTLQNDELQKWKERTMVHNAQYNSFNKGAKNAGSDSVLYKKLKAKADSVHLEYKNYTRQLATELPTGTLSEFLGKMFPKTYMAKMPDGTMKEIPLD